jgi:hypothetical protein
MAFWERVLFARCFAPLAHDSLTGAIMHAQYDENLHDFQVQFGGAQIAAEYVTVLFNAHLLNVEADDQHEHVRLLICATIEEGRPGRRFNVKAAVYVLAMGGIETVRALKVAGDLGDNRKGHLGRGFMVHPLIVNAARVKFAHPVETEIRGFFSPSLLGGLPLLRQFFANWSFKA